MLWFNLDPDRRYLLLDGFHIQVYDDLNQPAAHKSLASIVKNELITIVGNSLVFPVAAGVKVDRSYIIVNPVNENGEPTGQTVSLFDHYRPLTPSPPYRISVPTRGIYAEAVQGACDACEKVKDNSSQDWDKFKTDEPTPISTVTVPTPTVTDWKAAFKDFATPIVNIQNAPAAPNPGAGLAGLSELLGKNNIFPDITGLEGNQKNALATYLSNQENVKALSQMAKELAMQQHNTQNSEKIKGSINDAKNSGSINKDEANKLTKDHIQNMIDGGETKKAELEKANASKSSLTDAAVKAVEQGKTVKAENTDTNSGKSEKLEVEGNNSEIVLAQVDGVVPKLKQENQLACWATAATMMMSWKKGRSLTVTEVLTEVGNNYLQKFNNKEGLKSIEKVDFLSKLNMMGEAPANYPLQQYIDWLNTYGPLWITTDSNNANGPFSPHARIIKRIIGAGTPNGVGTTFIYNDPISGNEVSESFTDFIKSFEQMVTDNKSDNLFIQIVHFSDSYRDVTEGQSSTELVKISGDPLRTSPQSIELSELLVNHINSLTKVAGTNVCVDACYQYLIGALKENNVQILKLNGFSHGFPKIVTSSGGILPGLSFVKLFYSNKININWQGLPNACRGKGPIGALLFADLIDNRLDGITITSDKWPNNMVPGTLLQLWEDESNYNKVKDTGEEVGLGHAPIFLSYKNDDPNGDTIIVADQYHLSVEYTYPKYGLKYVIAARPSKINFVTN